MITASQRHSAIADPPVMAGKCLVVVLAHNEERRIGTCLESLRDRPSDCAVHVVVNGSSDRTAELASREEGVAIHDWAQGGKSRSWNRFVLDSAPPGVGVYVFVDGDAQLAPGSLAAMVRALEAAPEANAAAGMPLNGANGAAYRRGIRERGDMFGDLYALSGSFVDRMRASGIRLPLDLVGDDSLVGALAKTDLAAESNWDARRIVAVEDAGFYAETMTLSPAGLAAQKGRMINYSIRHFQNRIVSSIMRGAGPEALPHRMADLYPEWLGRFSPRRSPQWYWFDRAALKRMRAAADASSPMS